MAGDFKKGFSALLEARNPKLYMASKFLANPDLVANMVKGVRVSGFMKHKGVFSGLVELRAQQDPNRVGLIFDNGVLIPMIV